MDVETGLRLYRIMVECRTFEVRAQELFFEGLVRGTTHLGPGQEAVARGKVWPRGEAEPKAWSVEFEDPSPNREGSPALYGNATGILEGQTGAEIYYDNVSVRPNGK